MNNYLFESPPSAKTQGVDKIRLALITECEIISYNDDRVRKEEGNEAFFIVYRRTYRWFNLVV